MNSEQLTQKYIELSEHFAKYEALCTADKENLISKLQTLEQKVEATRSLAEDVHIMAINMKNMQEDLSDLVVKVNNVCSKDYKEYEENKHIVKTNILSVISGAIGTGLIWFLTTILKGGN